MLFYKWLFHLFSYSLINLTSSQAVLSTNYLMTYFLLLDSKFRGIGIFEVYRIIKAFACRRKSILLEIPRKSGKFKKVSALAILYFFLIFSLYCILFQYSLHFLVFLSLNGPSLILFLVFICILYVLLYFTRDVRSKLSTIETLVSIICTICNLFCSTAYIFGAIFFN